MVSFAMKGPSKFDIGAHKVSRKLVDRTNCLHNYSLIESV